MTTHRIGKWTFNSNTNSCTKYLLGRLTTMQILINKTLLFTRFLKDTFYYLHDTSWNYHKNTQFITRLCEEPGVIIYICLKAYPSVLTSNNIRNGQANFIKSELMNDGTPSVLACELRQLLQSGKFQCIELADINFQINWQFSLYKITNASKEQTNNNLIHSFARTINDIFDSSFARLNINTLLGAIKPLREDIVSSSRKKKSKQRVRKK